MDEIAKSEQPPEMPSLFYRLFGFWIRRAACQMASASMPSDWKDGDFGARLWSLTVFYESYMRCGASGTHADFGPKEKPLLALVNNRSAIE